MLANIYYFYLAKIGMDLEKLQLKVNINTKSGFCFGVVNAIKKAEKALEQHQEVYSVGQIVHNDEEINRLNQLGLETISLQELNKIHDSVVLFRAHGEPPESYRLAKKNNNLIIDASCPIILKLQDRIKESYEQGEKIAIFGRKDHPEVIALAAQTNNEAIVFNHREEIEDILFPSNITVYSQTTRSIDKFYDAIERIRSKGVEVKMHDTICRQVCNREENIWEFSVNHDMVVFIAGRSSSNGKVLYNVAKSANGETYFVSSSEELKREWFRENQLIGVCGATSTPRWQMEEVKRILETW